MGGAAEGIWLRYAHAARAVPHTSSNSAAGYMRRFIQKVWFGAYARRRLQLRGGVPAHSSRSYIPQP